MVAPADDTTGRALSRHTRQRDALLEDHLLEVADQDFDLQVPSPCDGDADIVDAPGALPGTRPPPPHGLDSGGGIGESESDFLHRERLEGAVENKHLRAPAVLALPVEFDLGHCLFAMQMDRNRRGRGQGTRWWRETPNRHQR